MNLLLLVSSVLSLPALVPSIVWSTDTTNIKTNVPFKLELDLKFPFWVTKPHIHPLIIDNPGPRPDNMIFFVNLMHENGTLVRKIAFHELAAKDGKYQLSPDYILPSYTLNGGQKFRLRAEMTNRDSWFERKTIKDSELFTITKAKDSEVKVADSEFLKHKDGVDGRIISLRFADWNRKRQLVVQEFSSDGRISTYASNLFG